MDSLIARQPIFDRDLNVWGYEIVCRPVDASVRCAGDGCHAYLSAIRNALLLAGTKTPSRGKKILLGFPRPLVMGGVAYALPRDRTVIYIVEEVEADREMVLACDRLKTEGFVLALDDISARSGAHRDLLPSAHIIKSPFELLQDRDGLEALREYLRLGKVVVAERVETRGEFDAACSLGYHLYQGSFFSKPSVIRSREIPSCKLNYLQVLQEVNRAELDFAQLEKVIKQDAALCYTLLNYINSAYFGLDESILSVRHALVLLGEREVRKWANLVLFTFLGFDKPSELILTSLVRARLCEALGHKMGMDDGASELFLTGMFSMLDALMQSPMVDILKGIHLSNEVEEALLRGSNVYGTVFNAVVSYEMGNWEDFSASMEKLGMEQAIVPDLYLQAVEWAEIVSNLREK